MYAPVSFFNEPFLSQDGIILGTDIHGKPISAPLPGFVSMSRTFVGSLPRYVPPFSNTGNISRNQQYSRYDDKSNNSDNKINDKINDTPKQLTYNEQAELNNEIKSKISAILNINPKLCTDKMDYVYECTRLQKLLEISFEIGIENIGTLADKYPPTHVLYPAYDNTQKVYERPIIKNTDKQYADNKDKQCVDNRNVLYDNVNTNEKREHIYDKIIICAVAGGLICENMRWFYAALNKDGVYDYLQDKVISGESPVATATRSILTMTHNYVIACPDNSNCIDIPISDTQYEKCYIINNDMDSVGQLDITSLNRRIKNMSNAGFRSSRTNFKRFNILNVKNNQNLLESNKILDENHVPCNISNSLKLILREIIKKY